MEDVLERAAARIQANDFDAAEALLESAVAHDPDFFEAWLVLGDLRWQRERPAAALHALERAAALRPDLPQCRNNLSAAYLRLGRPAAALHEAQQALQLAPSHVNAHLNAGKALHRLRSYGEALAHFEAALAGEAPGYDVLLGLGCTLEALGRHGEAVVALRRAIERSPESPEAYTNLANIYKAAGRSDEALFLHRRAIDLAPDFAEAHLNLGICYLANGRLSEGWPEYAWMWLHDGFWKPFGGSVPLWDGAPLAERTILVTSDQGFGDLLWAARYLPRVKELAGRVILEAPAPLFALLRESLDVECVLPGTHQGTGLDWYLPASGLARVFQTTLATIPAATPYLQAGAAQTAAWRARLRTDGSALHAGLVWAGNPGNSKDAERSCAPADYAALAGVRGVRWFSLQRDAAPPAFPAGMQVDQLGSEIQTFADTAAIVANLDLVITVDTALAHLAGALNIPVWVALAPDPHWLYLRERVDSPWYPSMRLFRRPPDGSWSGLFGALAGALRERLAAAR